MPRILTGPRYVALLFALLIAGYSMGTAGTAFGLGRKERKGLSLTSTAEEKPSPI
jgi:hypothetical protein